MAVTNRPSEGHRSGMFLKYPTMQGSAHEANNYLVQNVSSARVKKLWVNDAFMGNILCMYEISPLFFLIGG